MFKFNKSVNKGVDQELEEGELSDDGVDVINYTAPVSIQTKPKVQTCVDQQSGSQEYVFETIKITPAPERKKDRKELKINEKNKEQEMWMKKSMSPDSRNYQPQSFSPINSYYPYSSSNHHYPHYTSADNRAMIPPGNSVHASMYQRPNYIQGQGQWPNNQYQNYQYHQYGNNTYNGMIKPHQGMGNMPYHQLNTNQHKYNVGTNIYPRVTSPPNNPQQFMNPLPSYSNHQSNINYSLNFAANNEVIDAKRVAYQQQKQQKLQKKKIREQKLNMISNNIDKIIKDSFSEHKCSESNNFKANQQQHKNSLLQVLRILKGTVQENQAASSSLSIGSATLNTLSSILSNDEKLKQTVYKVLQAIQAKDILNKLREKQIERKILGNQAIQKYSQILKNIKRDPRINF